MDEQTQPQLQTFIVDMDGDDGQYISIDAYTVYNLEGDIVFADQHGVIIDMIAAGCWTRCKVGKL